MCTPLLTRKTLQHRRAPLSVAVQTRRLALLGVSIARGTYVLRPRRLRVEARPGLGLLRARRRFGPSASGERRHAEKHDNDSLAHSSMRPWPWPELKGILAVRLCGYS